VPLYKRAFNVCHPVLTVALAGALVALRADPTSLLHPGRVLIALPYLALLVALYYVFDVGTMLGVLALLQSRPPWAVWWQTYRRTLLPELATSTIGIIGAVAWWFDPVLLALFVLPVVALGAALPRPGS
jgi:hypothetical protein